MEKVGFLRQSGGGVIRLPPGFRFHPTDEELVVQYLKKKVFSCPLPASIIPDVELSRYDPWDLPGGGCGSEKERYFFNLREAKYRNGSRANRAAGTGYWKATGKDRQIMGSRGNQVIGMKKVLVFYRGKPPHGSRTDWVMHEYRLAGTGAEAIQNCIFQQRKDPSISSPTMVQMEGWVLCRIFEKKRATRNEDLDMGDSTESVQNEGRTNRIAFIDFLGRRDARPASTPLASESSCMTELSGESSSEEEGNSCNTSPLFPCRREH